MPERLGLLRHWQKSMQQILLCIPYVKLNKGQFLSKSPQFNLIRINGILSCTCHLILHYMPHNYILHYKEILKVVTPGEYMGHVYNISRFRAGQVSRLC